MNILYIAYSCSPCHGSEDKIGWQIPWESAKRNQVFVITKEEQRPFVEGYLKEHPRKNLHFYYVDIPSGYKKIYKGFFYSGRLNIWHRRALPVAEKICREYGISVIHQITPVEFRAIGNYGSIPGVRFVCGPVAGGQCIPGELASYAGRYAPVEWLRSAVNEWFRLRCRINGKGKSCSCLLFANEETADFLRPVISDDTAGRICPDVAADACSFSDPAVSRNPDGIVRFLTVGRLVYLKGHRFLLDALARIPEEMNYQCTIVGEGPERSALEEICRQRNLTGRVRFAGKIPHTEIGNLYESADVFVFPSLREATGTVLTEAISHGLPVIALNGFGGKVILGPETAWLVNGDSKEAYIENLKAALTDCISRPEEIDRRGTNARLSAREMTWEKRMTYYQSLYEDVCGFPKESGV